jgi:hypothetical protein
VDLNNPLTSLVGPPTKDSRQFVKDVGRNSAGLSVIMPIWNGQPVRDSSAASLLLNYSLESPLIEFLADGDATSVLVQSR